MVGRISRSHHCHVTSQARIIAAVKNIESMCAVSPVVQTSNTSSYQINLFSFLVTVNNSIKVGPLVFLL
jgi:hypothetical protein